jgi:hypothetical protein
MAQVRAVVAGMDDRARAEAAAHGTLPLPGVNWHLHADRAAFVDGDVDTLDHADTLLAETATEIARAFPAGFPMDARKSVRVRTYRRAWLQLARDLERAKALRHTAAAGGRQRYEAIWNELPEAGTGSPFFHLSQHALAENLRRILTERGRREAHGSVATLRAILAEGVFSAENQYDPTGLSRSSVAGEEAANGLDTAAYLRDGIPHGDPDWTLVFHPKVYLTPGAVAIPVAMVRVDDTALGLEHLLYRPDRIGRATVAFAKGIAPMIAAGAWDDIASLAWATHGGSLYAIPFGVPLADATHLILSPKLAPAVADELRARAREHGHLHVSVGDPATLLRPVDR